MIKTGSCLARTLHYNEQKVQEGVATCLLAANYPKDAASLTRAQKLNRLRRQVALNENVRRNSVHISLNFAPGEQLPPDRLREIAAAYMQRIGFGDQPYLVYEHRDAGHPHLHLVSVKVRQDGSRIDMHNIGRRQSARARQEIEQAFHLVPAGSRRQHEPLALQPVHYGHTETKRAIERVLEAVLDTYAYTSLPELNAVLGLYRVQADPGSARSRVSRHQGLTYRVLDGDGRKVGVPVKASAFSCRATLPYLEEKFRQHAPTRLPYRAQLRNRIDLVLLRQPPTSLAALLQALAREGIQGVPRQNAAGLVYGLTFVDHQTRSVFKGSDLGKAYSAAALQRHCDENQPPLRQAQEGLRPTPQGFTPPSGTSPGDTPLLDLLLQPQPGADYVPYQLRRGNRKKKRKHLRD